MPTVFTVVLQAVFLLHLPASEGVEWGRVQFKGYSPKPMIYVEPAGKKLVVYHGPMHDCDMVGDETTVSLRYRQTSNSTNVKVEVVSPRQMAQLVQKCQRIHQSLFARDPEAYFTRNHIQWDRNLVATKPKQPRGGKSDLSSNNQILNMNAISSDTNEDSLSLWSLNIFNRILIFPGTKWCGQGAVAEHYGDLGYHSEADRCCRDHDLCLTVTGEYLSPGHCRNGLCNFSPVTRSPCECDKAFVRCLRKAKTRVANALGRVFFNVAGLTCYKFDYPIKRCVEYVDVASGLPTAAGLPFWIVRTLSIHPEPQRPRCRRYELDVTKPKMWQFFETVYDDAYSLVDNSRSEEPRSYRRANSLSLFQKIIFDVFMSFIDPR